MLEAPSHGNGDGEGCGTGDPIGTCDGIGSGDARGDGNGDAHGCGCGDGLYDGMGWHVHGVGPLEYVQWVDWQLPPEPQQQPSARSWSMPVKMLVLQSVVRHDGDG